MTCFERAAGHAILRLRDRAPGAARYHALMAHGSPLAQFIDDLSAWGEALYRRGYPVPPNAQAARSEPVSASQAYAPLNQRAVELSLWLRSRGLVEQADALDAGLEDVRGWCWAYDDGRTSPFEIDIDNEQVYRDIDYIVEATQIGVAALNTVDASLPPGVWDGFVDG